MLKFGRHRATSIYPSNKKRIILFWKKLSMPTARLEISALPKLFAKNPCIVLPAYNLDIHCALSLVIAPVVSAEKLFRDDLKMCPVNVLETVLVLV